MNIELPTVLGLTICEDVVVEPTSRDVSLIRTFTGLSVSSFPATCRPFCVFGGLTDGFGEIQAELKVTVYAEGIEDIYRLRSKLHFSDRLQIVYYLMRVSRCPLPRPGSYVFSLSLEGEWMAQTSLRVY